ncbi:hypothetical protein EJB05_15305, partial [Eragrostis curvula]
MAGRMRREGEPPPVYGPGSSKFTVEVHHGGLFCGDGANRCYIDEKLSWFDNLDPEIFCYLTIEEMMVLLDYQLDLKAYWLLPGKGLADGLRIVSSDEETVIMKQLVDKVKNFVLYFDHHNYVGSKAWEDVHH